MTEPNLQTEHNIVVKNPTEQAGDRPVGYFIPDKTGYIRCIYKDIGRAP